MVDVYPSIKTHFAGLWTQNGSGRLIQNFTLLYQSTLILLWSQLCSKQDDFKTSTTTVIFNDHYVIYVVQPAGMNLLSKFCIAVSATRKLNCVAVGVICVAVFFVVFWRKKILELRDTFPAQPVQAILINKKKDSSSAAAMK